MIKPLITILAGTAFTLGLGIQKHETSDWSGGNGETPRTMMADYMAIMYDKGLGADAARKYHAGNFVDHASAAAELTNGAPVPHEVHTTISEGMNFSVYHRIAPARGAPAKDVVDIYRIEKGHITERWRIGA